MYLCFLNMVNVYFLPQFLILKYLNYKFVIMKFQFNVNDALTFNVISNITVVKLKSTFKWISVLYYKCTLFTHG